MNLTTRDTPATWVTPRKLYITAALICCIISVLAVFSLWTHFKNFEASSIERVELYARVMEDQVNRTFNSADATLQAVTDTLSSYKTPSIITINSLLTQQIQKTAFVRSLSLLDHSGKVVASSNPDNIHQQIPLDYFGVDISRPLSTAQLGKTVAGRDLATIVRTTDEHSRFTFLPYIQSVILPSEWSEKKGWIVATINPDFFANQHALLLDTENRSASMLHIQASYIVSTNEITPKLISIAPQHPFFTDFLPNKESGNMVGKGLTGSQVVGAFRTARNLPIVVIVEESYAFATQAFKTTMQLSIGVVSLVLILIAALTHGAVSRLRQHSKTVLIEQEKRQALLAMEKLKEQQMQLVQAEKIASLSLLVSNVAHEINTPIGAIKSSGGLIRDALKDTLTQLPDLFKRLSPNEIQLFNQLIQNYPSEIITLASREERNLVKRITQNLQEAGIEANQALGRLLLQFGVQDNVLVYLPLLQHPDSELIIQTASNIASSLISSKNINFAVERVSKIIFALKEFSSADQCGENMPLDLRTAVETVFEKYKSQMQPDFQIERDYEDLPPLPCLPEEIKQVCMHVIHNAFLAMHFHGKLTISIKRKDNHAVISVKDTGCGIREDHLPRIFDAFFTTRLSGEGCGLGLAIVKKIIDKHTGKIEVESQIGFGTTVTISLPYR